MFVLYYNGAEGVELEGVSSDVNALKKVAGVTIGVELTWIHYLHQKIWKGFEQDREDDEYFYVIEDVPFISTSILHNSNK